MLDVKRNLTTIMDFYELTMAAGYLEEGYEDKISVFDMFFRKVPDGGGYAIMAGLAQFIEAIDNLSFTEADIEYLRGTHVFNEKFLDYLRSFSFHCNVWAIEEGTPIFPQEPIVTVEGPSIECQLIETLLLVTFNHQCLIATKANRIVRSAAGRPVMEFGARRAQGPRLLHRWLRLHQLRDGRPRLRHSCLRHHGPQLGADVPQRIRCLQEVRPAVPGCLCAAGGHLQRHQERHSQRHQGV